MAWSYRIGILFGTEIRIHVTFFLLLVWVAMYGWSQGGPEIALRSVAFVLALFACVVAHEFGHALVARRYGIATPDITLLPIGGVARLERMPEKPGQEIRVAIAGPAVNLAILGALTLMLGLRPDIADWETLEGGTTPFLAQLAAMNLYLVLFNLVPAFPMDGGRVLRAVLSIRMGRPRATAVAARVGQVIAVGFGLAGLMTGNILLLMIAFFVFVAAGSESGDVEMRDLAAGIAARDATITAFEALAPEDGLMAMSAGLLRTTQHEFPVLDAEGRFLGFVTRDAIFHAAAGQAGTTAAEVMRTGLPVTRLKAPLGEVLDALAQGDVPAVAVLGETGGFVGYITRENIGELMVLRRARRG